MGHMISDNAVIWMSGLALSAAATGPVLLRMRRRELATYAAEAKALEYGLHEPATLHPVIDPDVCIGTGSCVDVCPEGDVFGFRNGQGVVVAPGACIGHGLCERSCPVEAIQLVYGTATRGVEIPRIRDDFQTNVDGLYIIGELGGMGLIRNAFEQGRQCIEGIVKRSRRSSDRLLDLVIVGAGPAGLAASLYAREAGLRFITLEREPDVGGTVRHYPRKKLVMTSPVSVPGFGKVGGHEILKEDLVGLWGRMAEGLPIQTGVTVKVVHKAGDGFALETDQWGYHARRVILAIGRRGIPRKLGVPGEELENVQYALAEPDAFRGDRVLVVGGGDSAIEAALAISEVPEAKVRISYRRDAFGRIKPGNRTRLGGALGSGRMEVLWSTNVARIEPGRVWLTGNDAGDAPRPLDNDQVLIFAGGELPNAFLRECGVDIETKFGTA
jgi:thioredoxin reductase/NAD-dependent dihydropyrimidine dehydrogenase PreA subunit